MAKKSVRPAADNAGDSPKKGGVDFEEALAEAEEVVKQLESGELGLAESLDQYELGIKRIKQCHESLREAQRRVSLLSGIDEDGEAILEPFGPDSSKTKPAMDDLTSWDDESDEDWDEDDDSVDESPGLF
ncbi:exodeoxyribonuclease VII small subunit [Stieleria varia]|uniref:Exodeoxyribonuclease 7 small subunit n=1 Tax=Stieleria varia TaxID=2528005 RepID=A0A5C6B981_9BACT|nr:exodeoxyribonuclease VII small subunit [Stieleria varia]TWU08520.1 Exodeoxyribonuclease 7 small subunit [Stieleria varia]